MRRPYDKRTIRAAVAACERVALSWDREARLRIDGKGSDDDWGAACDCAAAARECARAIARLGEGEPCVCIPGPPAEKT